MTDHSDLIARLNTWLKLDAHNGYSKTNALIEEAATALEAMGADAERYRWLRDPARLHTIMVQQFSPKLMDLHGDNLDAEVDAGRRWTCRGDGF